MQKMLNYSVAIAIVAVFCIGGYFYWLHQQLYPNTDDAYIQAHVVDIASQITGKVIQVFVKDHQEVKKNQLLFTIDPKPFEIAYQKAIANLQNTLQTIAANQQAVIATKAILNQREAELKNAHKNYDRVMSLVKRGYYAKAAGDDATEKLTVAKQAVTAANSEYQEILAKLGQLGDQNASIRLAKSTVAQAQLNLNYTSVYAPSDGMLAKFNLQPGQTITAYQPLFSLVENRTWWVIANIKETDKETDLDRIHPGQKAVIFLDMYPNHPFHGIVSSISPGSGSSFALLPPENASGNWVKVVQRFPVNIEISNNNPKFPLRIGASCTATIDTRS